MSPYSLILFLNCAHTLVSAVTDVDFKYISHSEVSNTDQLPESGSNDLYFVPDIATTRKNERHFPDSLRFKENFQAESSQSGCFIYKLKKWGKKADCSYQGLSSIADLHLDDPGSISVLDLTGNNVETIPMGVWTEYSGLKYLILSINNLTRLENNSFWGLSKLKRLDLQGNYIAMTKENVPENVFQPLTSLSALHLENNTHSNLSTTETYPHWALAHIPSLKSLYLDGFRDQKFGVGFRNMTSLRYLSLNGFTGRCYLGHLKNDTFEHLGQLENLTMKRCGIYANGIDKGVLGPFTKLRRLDVSRNVDINLDGVIPLLYAQAKSTTLFSLDMNMVVNPFSVSRCVSNELARSLPRNLIYINAAFNNLEMVSNEVFSSLPPKLKYLTLNGNRFLFGSYLKNFSRMANLQYLELNGWVEGFKIPTYYADKDQQPSSKCTFAKATKKEKIVFKLPPNLETLEIAEAQMSLTISRFNFSSNNSLKTLIAKGNNLPSLVGPVKGLNKLERLVLSHNNIKYISASFFEYFPNLKSLDLSHNNCGKSFSQETKTVKFPSTLIHLTLSHNLMNNFSLHFDKLQNLTSLELAYCSMIQFKPDLSNARGLKYLNLASNSIYTLKPYVTAAIDRIPNLTLNISENGIACYCDNLKFARWLVSFPRLTDKNLSQLSCSYDGSITKVHDFRKQYLLMERECASDLLLLSICISFSASFVLLTIVALAYRFRWNLRFWYYSRMSSDGPTRCPGNYEADMFVTYCEANEDFAEETLNNALSSLGCRLRIQGRDFRPGASTVRDIVEAVQACRRTLVILSPQTVSSKWCMATVNLAAIESSHSSRPVLVFLALGAINASNLGAELLFHIKNSMIFFFPPPENWRNERAMNLFWRRLYNAVR